MRLRAEAAPSHLWVPELSPGAERVELSREESHYLRHVCRAQPGDVALATDGRGALARLRVTALGERGQAEAESFEPGAPEHTGRRPRPPAGRWGRWARPAVSTTARRPGSRAWASGLSRCQMEG